jgi:gamma-glutamyl-gamma-aminobutyrate hydrolase PuuD
VIARAHDGIVEAVDAPDHPSVEGVQFHPEELTAHAHMRALFEAFVGAAAHERVALPAAGSSTAQG